MLINEILIGLVERTFSSIAVYIVLDYDQLKRQSTQTKPLILPLLSFQYHKQDTCTLNANKQWTLLLWATLFWKTKQRIHVHSIFCSSLFLHLFTGSTDVMAYDTTGVNDPVTSAIQIILGMWMLIFVIFRQFELVIPSKRKCCIYFGITLISL